MGRNVDLTRMLGLPEEISCPECKAECSTRFEDYDIDDEHTNPRAGLWVLLCYCEHCEHEWKARFQLSVTLVK